MSEDTTCYNCKNHNLCYLRRAFWSTVLEKGAGMLLDDACAEMFKVVAKNCREFVYQKEV